MPDYYLHVVCPAPSDTPGSTSRADRHPGSLPHPLHTVSLFPGQVICEKADRTDIPTIDKKKYLVPSVSQCGHAIGSLAQQSQSVHPFPHARTWPTLTHAQDLTVGQFVYVIRKRIKLAPEKAIFIFVDEVLPATAALMSAIYEEHKDDDGFLYVSYSGENTFGSMDFAYLTLS